MNIHKRSVNVIILCCDFERRGAVEINALNICAVLSGISEFVVWGIWKNRTGLQLTVFEQLKDTIIQDGNSRTPFYETSDLVFKSYIKFISSMNICNNYLLFRNSARPACDRDSGHGIGINTWDVCQCSGY
jgi:hypothetical protein